MKSVKGKYDGKKVLLDEEVPVTREVPVVVTFPDDENIRPEDPESGKIWHWDEARGIKDDYKGSVVDVLLAERRE